MNRDMDLVRKLLLALEAGTANQPIEGYTSDQLKYHKALVIEAGLAEGTVAKDMTSYTEVPRSATLLKLTWKGHDLIDAIRDDTAWSRVKAHIFAAGKVLMIETIKWAVQQLFGVGD